MATTNVRSRASKLTERLLAERERLSESHTHAPDIASRVAAREARYGIPSAEVGPAIDRGELEETLDVCQWLLDYDPLRRAESR